MCHLERSFLSSLLDLKLTNSESLIYHSLQKDADLMLFVVKWAPVIILIFGRVEIVSWAQLDLLYRQYYQSMDGTIYFGLRPP